MTLLTPTDPITICVPKYSLLPTSYSNQDHPLSRLLGEYQMEVFSLLKPVHSAVERAGGLPCLDIRLKSEGEQGE